MSAAAKVANCNVSSVSRHVKNHLAKHVAELTMPEALRVETINVVNELERSTKRLDKLYEELMAAGNRNEAIRALAEKRKHVELIGKLTGQSRKETTEVSVMTSPSFAILHQALKVLDPEAQRAVSDEIERLNNGNER